MNKDSLPTIKDQLIGPQQLHERRENKARLLISKWWQGNIHTHSELSTRDYGRREGIYSLREIKTYVQGLGLPFVCLTEHTSDPGNPMIQGLESWVSHSLLSEAKEITQLNQEPGKTVLLSGAEVNIVFTPEGKPALDIPDQVLAQLDLVIASRHAIAREKDPQAVKESILYAVSHPLVDVIGHPDRYTRKDGEQPKEYWDEYWAIWPDIIEAMVKQGKAFEISLTSLPHPKIIEMVLHRQELKLSLNFDFHDIDWRMQDTDLEKLLTTVGVGALDKWVKGESLEEKDLEVLRSYKLDRLTGGPGARSILRLARWIKTLEHLEVNPKRIINSSKENLLNYLTKDRGKQTENLKFLTNR